MLKKKKKRKMYAKNDKGFWTEERFRRLHAECGPCFASMAECAEVSRKFISIMAKKYNISAS